MTPKWHSIRLLHALACRVECPVQLFTLRVLCMHSCNAPRACLTGQPVNLKACPSHTNNYAAASRSSLPSRRSRQQALEYGIHTCSCNPWPGLTHNQGLAVCPTLLSRTGGAAPSGATRHEDGAAKHTLPDPRGDQIAWEFADARAAATSPEVVVLSHDRVDLAGWIDSQLFPEFEKRALEADTIRKQRLLLSQFCEQVLVELVRHNHRVTSAPLVSALTALVHLKQIMGLRGYIQEQAPEYVKLMRYLTERYTSRLGTAKLHNVGKMLLCFARLEHPPPYDTLKLSTKQLHLKPFNHKTIGRDVANMCEALGLFGRDVYVPFMDDLDVLATTIINSLHRFSPHDLSRAMKGLGQLGQNPLQGALGPEVLKYAEIHRYLFSTSDLIHLIRGMATALPSPYLNAPKRLLYYTVSRVRNSAEELDYDILPTLLEGLRQYHFVERTRGFCDAVSARLLAVQPHHKLYYVSSLLTSISTLRIRISQEAQRHAVDVFRSVSTAQRGGESSEDDARCVLQIALCLSRMGLLCAVDVLKLIMFLEAGGHKPKGRDDFVLYQLALVPLVDAPEAQQGVVRQIQAHWRYRRACQVHRGLPAPPEVSWPIQALSSALHRMRVDHTCNARLADGTIVDILIRDHICGSGTRQLAVVVHRTSAYSSNSPRVLLGTAVHRVQILRGLGYEVVEIPQAALQIDASTSQRHEEYIRKRIEGHGVQLPAVQQQGHAAL